ncbi:hypothetical protein GCM10008013_41220 [Paenibacillus segetis]|uniref:Uncharacterized protein n=1 Tax=Paenibacillus segetis TaxID=1325360 RepID=A0ABQ1YQP7_9BACL|nr:hypothetical protein GCM10008013_41220 [Paenibacillus segetis]
MSILVQGSRNSRRLHDAGPCSHVGNVSVKKCGLNVHGIFKGEKFANDIREAYAAQV